MFLIFSASTSVIALISISMERSVHGGVHGENCTAKACHMAKLWRFEWGQVRLELFWRKAGRSWSLEELRNPFFFELIAKLTDAISCTQSKSLCVAMVMEQRVLWPPSPASRPIDWSVEASTNFKRWRLFIKMATDWQVSEEGDTGRPVAGPGSHRSVQIEIF